MKKRSVRETRSSSMRRCSRARKLKMISRRPSSKWKPSWRRKCLRALLSTMMTAMSTGSRLLLMSLTGSLKETTCRTWSPFLETQPILSASQLKESKFWCLIFGASITNLQSWTGSFSHTWFTFCWWHTSAPVQLDFISTRLSFCTKPQKENPTSLIKESLSKLKSQRLRPSASSWCLQPWKVAASFQTAQKLISLRLGTVSTLSVWVWTWHS